MKTISLTNASLHKFARAKKIALTHSHLVLTEQSKVYQAWFIHCS